jgi:ABC-type transport system substrate-binding protein
VTDSAAILHVATEQEPTSLSPCAGNGGFDFPYLDLMYAPLIDAQPSTLNLQPGIASSWGFTGANNLTFNLTIRPGLTFQDGTPVNAQAVKQSMQYCLGLGITTVPSLKSITVTGPDTLSIGLSAPTSGLPGLLSSRLGMIVSPTAVAKYGKNFADHPVGAGPYELASEVPDSSYDFTRFTGYQPAGEPAAKMAGIDITLISSDTALTNAMTSGTDQYAFGVDTTNVPVFQQSGNLTVKLETAIAFTDFVIDSKDAPVNNVDVRLAMEYALNRQSILEAAQNGDYGGPAWAAYPQGTPFYDASAVNAWPYNPTKAKQLLAEAGYPNGVNITGLAITGPPFEPNSVLAQAQWAKVGIHVHFTDEAGPQAVSGFAAHNAADIFAVGWDATPTVYLTYFGLFDSESYYNENAAPNAAIDNDINALNSTYTTSGQLALVEQIDKVIDQQATIIPLYFQPDVVVFSKNVHGEDPDLTGEPDMNYLSMSS